MNKKSYFLFLTIFLVIILEARSAFAAGCSVCDVDIYWTSACSGSEKWKDYCYDYFLGGGAACMIGASSTDYGHTGYYGLLCDLFGCTCPKFNDVVWKYGGVNSWPSGGTEGQICKVRWDAFANPCANIWEGKWDPDNSVCVQCDSNRRETRRNSCSGSDYVGDTYCEVACGAKDGDIVHGCDERLPGGDCNRCLTDSDTVVRDYNCGSDCLCQNNYRSFYCDSSTHTNCQGIGFSAGDCGYASGFTVYCTYDGSSWRWRQTKPSENCCDGVDNDCDGYTDIADSDCSGRCCSDSDCSSQNNIKGQCISNVCQWPPCDADSDCTSGLCYCGGSACYSSFTSASCSAGYCCNRGYGGSGIGSCVYQGTTYNNIYLCDP
jgi:hypothetical protein